MTENHLNTVGISKKEFDQIKLLLSLDKEFFKPSEYGTFSPHSMIVDLSQFESLSKEAKNLLYKPTKVKLLYEKYWQLAKVVNDIDKEEKDRKILKDGYSRYPVKSKEEIELADRIYARIEELIDEDLKNLTDEQRTVASDSQITSDRDAIKSEL